MVTKVVRSICQKCSLPDPSVSIRLIVIDKYESERIVDYSFCYDCTRRILAWFEGQLGERA